MKRNSFVPLFVIGSCLGAAMAFSGPGSSLFMEQDAKAQNVRPPVPVNPICYKPMATTGVPGCNKLPTSLPCLDVNAPDPNGFANTSGSQCGWKRVFVFLVRPCGPPIGDVACIGGVY